MATLQQAIAAIQADIRALTGIVAAPDYAPEQVNAFPFCIVYPTSGDFVSDIPGSLVGLHTITIELHIARKDLPRDIAQAMVYVESIPNVLLKTIATQGGDRFGGTISTFERITYDFGPLDWGGTQTVGFRFRLVGVKMQKDIT
jgi:hypothetical protein